MPNIMFWNVRDGAALSQVPVACFENSIDLLILAEDQSSAGYVTSLLNSIGGGDVYFEFAPVRSDIRFYCKNPGSLSMLADEGERVSIRSYSYGGGESIIITAVHLRSKLRSSEDDQYQIARMLRLAIDKAEDSVGHSRSIVIGDFNMNPFEKGIVSHDALHGVMTKRLAKQKSRIFNGVKSDFFYNPMWNFLGDETKGPPGTYFYNAGGSVNYYWNIFDQVLIRPELLDGHDSDSVQIISNIGGSSLVENDRISSSSDHLPIVYRLSLR
jgi:hypothetical protein